jgi:hypothetical protein
MESAREFIRSMYDENGYFYIGTQSDGITSDKRKYYFRCSSLDDFSFGKRLFADPSVIDMVISMKTTEGGFPFHKENTKGGFGARVLHSQPWHFETWVWMRMLFPH